MSTAENLRRIGRDKFPQSIELCDKVFKMQEQGLIELYHSAFAHSIMAHIAGEMCETKKELMHSWALLEKTHKLGD